MTLLLSTPRSINWLAESFDTQIIFEAICLYIQIGNPLNNGDKDPIECDCVEEMTIWKDLVIE